jgi:hypothetical protein
MTMKQDYDGADVGRFAIQLRVHQDVLQCFGYLGSLEGIAHSSRSEAQSKQQGRVNSKWRSGGPTDRDLADLSSPTANAKI